MLIFKLKVILRYQGKSFVDRFDANSYLYITRAMDYFDVTKLFPRAIELNADLNKHINYLIISFTSDWLFPTKENLQIVEILNRNIHVKLVIQKLKQTKDMIVFSWMNLISIKL